MADDIESMLRDAYGPSTSDVNDLIASRPVPNRPMNPAAWPTLPPINLRDDRPSMKPYLPGGETAEEAAAAQLGRDLREGNYGNAALGAGSLILGAMPAGAARRGKGAAKAAAAAPVDDFPFPGVVSSTPPKALAKPAIVRSEKVPGVTVESPHGWQPMFPGLYEKSPKQIAAEAAERAVPESPNLMDVFGVNRADLSDINEGGTRRGNVAPEDYLKFAANPRGSQTAEPIMTRKNAQRVEDMLAEAEKYPGLSKYGMDNWYVMDPLYQHFERLFGDEAPDRYRMFNDTIAMMSPGTPVPDEIKRGLLAHYLNAQGRPEDFKTFGGLMEPDPLQPYRRGMSEIGVPVGAVPGHMYHSTATAGPWMKRLELGKIDSDKQKVPSYALASGVPETGFQTQAPVGDSHFARALGFDLTRQGVKRGKDIQMSELQSILPWFTKIMPEYENVTKQGRLWGVASGQTGVDSPIGAPKLEMLADHIARRAAEHGIPLDVARDKILKGEMYKDGGDVEDADDDNAILKEHYSD